jgi:hypothetical protein
MRCAGRVAHVGRSACVVLMGKLKERDQLGDLGLDERVILNFISNSLGRAWTGVIWLRRGVSDKVCECGNKL